MNTIPDFDISLIETTPAQRKIRPTPEQIVLVGRKGLPEPLLVKKPAASLSLSSVILLKGAQWLRAAVLTSRTHVPITILDEDEQLALLESETVCPITRARAIKRLLDSSHTLSLTKLAKGLGVTLSHLSHYHRLLQLPETVQAQITQGKLRYAQARALLFLDNPRHQITLASLAVEQQLSARTIERAARLMQQERTTAAVAVKRAVQQKPPSRQSPSTQPPPPSPASKDANIIRLENELSAALGTQVELTATQGQSGAIVIRYANYDILDGLLDQLLNRLPEDAWD